MRFRLRAISVPGAVNVAVVPCVALVFDMTGVDSDTTSFLFWRLVNIGVVGELGAAALRKNLGDSSRQGGLAMVDVTLRGTVR